MQRSSRVREVLQPVLGALLYAPACVGALPSPATLDSAQAQQRALVAAWPAVERVAGFKAAFNSPALQQRFGLGRPAFAAPPASAARCAGAATGCAVSRAGYKRMVLEIEVALRLGAAIDAPLADEAALLERLDGAMPAIELPELALDGVAEPGGLDYVASNIGVRGYILGAVSDPAVLRTAAPRLTLARGERVVAEGSGGAALAAALALVNAVVADGYVLRPGQVLLTGAVGGMVPAEPGEYVADCGALGRLQFTLR